MADCGLIWIPLLIGAFIGVLFGVLPWVPLMYQNYKHKKRLKGLNKRRKGFYNEIEKRVTKTGRK